MAMRDFIMVAPAKSSVYKPRLLASIMENVTTVTLQACNGFWAYLVPSKLLDGCWSRVLLTIHYYSVRKLDGLRQVTRQARLHSYCCILH